jgi:hypothetical protein
LAEALGDGCPNRDHPVVVLGPGHGFHRWGDVRLGVDHLGRRGLLDALHHRDLDDLPSVDRRDGGLNLGRQVGHDEMRSPTRPS